MSGTNLECVREIVVPMGDAVKLSQAPGRSSSSVSELGAVTLEFVDISKLVVG